jgi:hypothetical protein
MCLLLPKSQQPRLELGDFISVCIKGYGRGLLACAIGDDQLKCGDIVVLDSLAQGLFAILGMGQQLAGENRRRKFLIAGITTLCWRGSGSQVRLVEATPCPDLAAPGQGGVGLSVDGLVDHDQQVPSQPAGLTRRVEAIAQQRVKGGIGLAGHWGRDFVLSARPGGSKDEGLKVQRRRQGQRVPREQGGQLVQGQVQEKDIFVRQTGPIGDAVQLAPDFERKRTFQLAGVGQQDAMGLPTVKNGSAKHLLFDPLSNDCALCDAVLVAHLVGCATQSQDRQMPVILDDSR